MPGTVTVSFGSTIPFAYFPLPRSGNNSFGSIRTGDCLSLLLDKTYVWGVS